MEAEVFSPPQKKLCALEVLFLHNEVSADTNVHEEKIS